MTADLSRAILLALAAYFAFNGALGLLDLALNAWERRRR